MNPKQASRAICEALIPNANRSEREWVEFVIQSVLDDVAQLTPTQRTKTNPNFPVPAAPLAEILETYLAGEWTKKL